MTASEAFAPAKVNLTLHVTGQRPDGYHRLDSLVAFATVGDRLRLDPGPEMALEVSGPFAAGVPCDLRNLAWRAAEQAGWTGRISLEKHLPHGAGIGGGSSDAGAVLRALGAGRGAVELGADVPVCVLARAARMQGIGEDLTPVDLPPLPAVLVNPGAIVPTPAVFKALKCKDNAPMPVVPDLAGPDQWIAWLSAQRNDLEAPARAVAPVIGDVLTALEVRAGARLCRMSGSGATCFAVFDSSDAAQRAAADLSAAHPDWWVVPTRLA